MPGDECPDGSGCAPMAKRIKPSSSAAAASRSLFSSLDTQVIYCGDNLDKLAGFPDIIVDLIYIDPPFNSNRNYEIFWPEDNQTRSFEDRHASTQAYIDFMRPRCTHLRRILKDSGSFYYHCDWHASHYVKVMLDQIFGENQFQAEIIWERTNSRSEPSRWPRVHDTLYHYSKTSKFYFDRLMVPGNAAKVPHTLIVGPDGRKYNTYELTGSGRRNGESGRPWRGYNPDDFGRHWGYNHAQLSEWDAAGLIHWPKKSGKSGGFPRRRAEEPFVAEFREVQLGDVWTDIDRINQSAGEKVGYPTQKPLSLLERIIRSSSDKDDIVLDAFCGCGTALVAAQNLGRRWVGIDISPTACNVMADRLERDCGLAIGKDFSVVDETKDEEFLRRIPHFEFENWAVLAIGGIPNAAKVNDWGIDGRIYPASHMPGQSKRDESKFNFMDHWYPVQVKQVDQVGRQEIDLFSAAMERAGRTKGYFVSFGFSGPAFTETRRLREVVGRNIVPITVREILDKEDHLAMKLP